MEILNPNIKLVCFDFGGVVIDLFPEKTLEAFQKLGAEQPEKLYNTIAQTSLFDELDKGNLSSEEFIDNLKKYFSKDVSARQIQIAWNAMLGKIDRDKMEYIRRLSEWVPVCLLSNTNEIHLDYISSEIIPSSGVPRMEEIFHRTYYSCRLGMRKPEKRIFEWVSNEYGLKGNQILFLDDTDLHLQSAASLGWNVLKVERNAGWIQNLMECLKRN